MTHAINTDKAVLNVKSAVICIKSNKDQHSNVNNARMLWLSVMNAAHKIYVQNALKAIK